MSNASRSIALVFAAFLPACRGWNPRDEVRAQAVSQTAPPTNPAVDSLPGRAELDARFPTVPVMLTRVDGHALWVNAEALRRAAVTRQTADPPGGRILQWAKAL